MDERIQKYEYHFAIKSDHTQMMPYFEANCTKKIQILKQGRNCKNKSCIRRIWVLSVKFPGDSKR